VSLEHIGFGTLNGPDGKPFKTRSGGVMRLQELLEIVRIRATERLHEAGIAKDLPQDEFEEIARLVSIAAIKFSDLSKPRLTNYIFDVDQFTAFEGATGPYLLYATVRIKSILRKANDLGLNPGELLIHEGSRELMLKLQEFSMYLEWAFNKRTPHVLCEYAYGLAQAFSRFYQSCHILKEEDKALQGSWLALCSVTLRVLETTLNILGIEAPERM
jgi:arginyl-tRNA synthetase